MCEAKDGPGVEVVCRACRHGALQRCPRGTNEGCRGLPLDTSSCIIVEGQRDAHPHLQPWRDLARTASTVRRHHVSDPHARMAAEAQAR